MYNRKQNARLFTILCAFFLSFFLLFLRLTYLQLIKHRELTALAASQHNLTIDIPPERGKIYDRNKKELAASVRFDSVYAVPRDIENERGIAHTLANLLGVDEDRLAEKLRGDKGFVWVARGVPYEKAETVRRLGLKGIDFQKEYRRFYPNGTLCSHLLGCVGIDGNGLDGIELYFDKYLRGNAGLRSLRRDAKGNALAAFEWRHVPARDGLNLVLTIDEVIQHIAERELDKAVNKSNASAGTIVVMDPRTGDILALANRPTFDPNRFWNYDDRQRRNRAVCDIFEPGSTFKTVTASAVLNENLLRPETRFFCENGSYYYAGHTLHDHKPHGWLSFREVVELSSNIGMCKVAQILGSARLYRYIKLFGFGDKTDIELPGEVSGIIKPPRAWSKVSITNIPMGQEVAVTAIQMACAISAIANEGVLVKPRIVRQILDDDGEVVCEQEPAIVRKVISPQTSAAMRDFLKGVIEDGTGKLARVEGYDAGGKTGTAQKVEAGGYSHSKFVASFVGFAPASKPAVVITVVLDEPHPYYFGGTVAAPVFSKVARDALRYMEVGATEKPGMAMAGFVPADNR